MPEIREQLTLYDNFSRTLNNYIQMMEACQTSTANLATLSQNAARQVTVLMSSYRMAASQMNTNTSEINQQAAANRQLGQSHRETDAATRAQITAMDQQIVTINRQIAEINQQVAASRLLEQSHRETEAAIRSQTATIDQQIVTINRQSAEINQQVVASRLSEQSHRESEAAIRAETSAIDQQIVVINRQIAELNQQAAASRAADAANRARLSQLRLEEAQVRRNTSAVDGLVSGLQNLAGAYLGFQGIQMLASASDNLVSTNARLQLMTGSAEEAKQLQNMIYQSAQRSRGLYTETASFVAKLGTLAGDAFGDTNELVTFAEQINKQMVLSGTSTAEASGAMLQLTQALASGTLRGEELNSVMEQTPMIAQTIAQYMGGISTGELRTLASEGLVSSEIVKNAILDVADEIDQKFEQMPMTWGQVWNQMQNTALKVLEPVLMGVNWVANHIDNLAPYIATATGAMVALVTITKAQALWTAANTAGTVAYNLAMMGQTVVLGVAALATGNLTLAQRAYNAALLTSPVGWIALGIGIVIGLIYQWIESVGGIKVAWLIFTNTLISTWDWATYHFTKLYYNVLNGLDMMGYQYQAFTTNVDNWIGDMKISVLNHMQGMVNGGIDMLNDLITTVNDITGTKIEMVNHVTFAAEASVLNEAAKQARNNTLAATEQNVIAKQAQRANELYKMLEANNNAKYLREQQIKQEQVLSQQDSGWNFPNYDDFANTLGGISDSVASIDKSVSMSEEDIRSLVDQAERRYVANVNLTSKSPVINVYGQNTGNTESDRRMIADVLRDVLLEQVSADSVVATAIV